MEEESTAAKIELLAQKRKLELLEQKRKHILALQTNQDDPSIREQPKQIAMEARRLRSSSLREKGIHYTSSSKYQIHEILIILK